MVSSSSPSSLLLPSLSSSARCGWTLTDVVLYVLIFWLSQTELIVSSGPVVDGIVEVGHLEVEEGGEGGKGAWFCWFARRFEGDPRRFAGVGVAVDPLKGEKGRQRVLKS